MAFRKLKSRSVRWRPVEGAGLEHLTVRSEGAAIVARSVVIGQRGGRRYGARYTIVCDADWWVRSLELDTTEGRRLRLSSDRDGNWTDDDGCRLTALDGCIDIDLAGTPFTNTLPIRRLDLDPEQGAIELAMVYVPFDTFTPIVDGQRYQCLEKDLLFRYEAADRSFAAVLAVDEDGLVLDYPTLFERVRE
jgi:hypothetical protein